MVPRLGTSHVYLSFVFDLVATSHPVQVPFPFFWTMVFPFTFSFPIFLQSVFSHLVFKEKATKKIFLFPDLLNHLRPKLNL